MAVTENIPPPAPWTRSRVQAVLLPILGVALLARLLLLNEGYFDFGDGNYLYICWRMGEGARLYADILSPQPPLHLHLGMVILWVGDLFGNSTLTIRAVQAMVRVLTGWLVYRVGRAWGFGRGTGVLAAAIFLLSPIGDRWSLGWQSENIEIPLLLTMQILLAKRGSGWLLGSGLCAAGALLCNMTAAPYVLFTALYAVIAFRLRGLLFALGLFGGWGVFAAFFEFTTGAFFSNVIGNQVGSYPSGDEFWPYVWDKLGKGLRGVAVAQGVWTVLGLVGLFTAGVLSRRKWNDPHALYWGVYSLGAFLSITYTSKGGTADYIFCLAEPHVALWAAWALVEIAGLGSHQRLKNLSPNVREFIRMACLGMVPSLFMLGVFQVSSTFIRMHSQEGYEWPEDRMRLVTEQIEARSGADDLILAPPHFAYETRRHLVEDFSSTYLWYTKWANETMAMESDENAEIGEGIAMMNRIAHQIREGDVAFIALNGLSPELIEPTANGLEVPIDAGYDNRYIARIDQIRAAVLETCQRVGPRVSLTSNLYWGPSRVLRDVHYMQEELTLWVPRSPTDE